MPNELTNVDHVSSLSVPYPDSEIHGPNMGSIGGRQGPGGPHVGIMNFAIWVYLSLLVFKQFYPELYFQ